jgi:hypothetical protein
MRATQNFDENILKGSLKVMLWFRVLFEVHTYDEVFGAQEYR